DAVRAGAALARLHGRLAAFDFGVPRLVHGDPAPAHLFWDGSGRLTWIDFGTVHYGHPGQDLAMIAQWIGPAEKLDDFLRLYLRDDAAARDGGEAAISALKEAIALFAELKLWDKLCSRIAKRSNHAHRPERQPKLAAEQEKIERQIAA